MRPVRLFLGLDIHAGVAPEAQSQNGRRGNCCTRGQLEVNGGQLEDNGGQLEVTEPEERQGEEVALRQVRLLCQRIHRPAEPH